jgi:hypothetical protein
MQEISQGEMHMPLDSLLVTAAVVLVFVAFGSVVAWADRRTRSL